MTKPHWRNTRPRPLFTLIYCLVMLLLTALLLFLARRVPGFAEWYAATVFPIFPATLGRVLSLLPFSLFEIVIYSTALQAVVFVVGSLLMLCRAAWRRLLPWRLLRGLLYVPRLACGLLLMFMLTCGINYSRDTFATQAGLALQPSSAAELQQLYEILLTQITTLDAAVPRAADGQIAITPRQAAREAKSAMFELSLQYDKMPHYYPNAKPMLFSRGMSYLQISGIYSPFTIEANYNRHMPSTTLPVTVCHELAHLIGYAREDEANFIGYLACANSTQATLRYSGTYLALHYTLNALAGVLPQEQVRELAAALPAAVRADLQRNSEYWASFAGPVGELSSSANDRYLKANDQQEGVRSYGRMVDLLLAYYRDLGLIGTPAVAAGAAAPQTPPRDLPGLALTVSELSCQGAVLLDVESSTVLYAKNPDTPLHPASLTKVMTALVALERIDNLEAQITFTEEDFAGLEEAGASISGFEIGETVRYIDLLYTLMLPSGCDSANALANNLAGGLDSFAALMNDKLAELGLSHSRFANPSGLTDARQLVSALDMAMVMRAAVAQPLLREIMAAKEYQAPPTAAHEEGLKVRSYFFYRIDNSFQGAALSNGATVLGGKTGFTNAAGLCLAVLCQVEGREYIAVILGAPDMDGPLQPNFVDALRLFAAL